MAAKTSASTKHRSSRSTKKERQSLSWLNYFRFGESYSSLLLGIIVVIITTVLLVFLVRDRNITQQNIGQKSVSSTRTERSEEVTVRPTKIAATSTPAPTRAVAKDVSPVPQNKNVKTHIVVNGENLWTIAEKYYKSGYNWVDISRVNNLSNPGIISIGMKLTIPDVASKVATITTPDQTVFGPKITGSTYKVEKGDHLWGIAVRAYADGYRWVEIARVNNIATPDVIHPGLALKLPRTVSPSQK